MPRRAHLRHKHQCGWDEVNSKQVLDLTKGCGHIWSHVPPLHVTDEERDRLHMCPRCGRGPWTWKLYPEDELRNSRATRTVAPARRAV